MDGQAIELFWRALTLNAGYNAALVGIGAALFGWAAGTVGAYLFLRKRAMVSDAVAHATLPGVAAAFLVMTAFGGDGRHLAGLLAGAAASAAIGLLLVDWMTKRTRLAEDAAIGAVLSGFFGLGVALLTVIQTAGVGRPAGLEGFLLGSTAGMLFQDALLIAVGGALAVAAATALRRPMTMAAFDPEYAAAEGLRLSRIDLGLLALALAVTVIGLKLVGLVLIVALLIIPPVTARFWTDRADRVALIGGALGALSAYVGAAISASAPALPTGPIIVLTATALFAASFLAAPARGVLAAALRRRRFQVRVHRRQGLLALARGEAIHDPLTLRILKRDGAIRSDGVATPEGRGRAAKALLDEARWAEARRLHGGVEAGGRFDGLDPIETALTADQIREIDARLGPVAAISRG